MEDLSEWNEDDRVYEDNKLKWQMVDLMTFYTKVMLSLAMVPRAFWLAYVACRSLLHSPLTQPVYARYEGIPLVALPAVATLALALEYLLIWKVLHTPLEATFLRMAEFVMELKRQAIRRSQW